MDRFAVVGFTVAQWHRDDLLLQPLMVPLIVGRPDPLTDQALEDASLLIQQIYDEVELLLDGSRTGDDEECGFVVDDRVACSWRSSLREAESVAR